jgi:hypothetical protein
MILNRPAGDGTRSRDLADSQAEGIADQAEFGFKAGGSSLNKSTRSFQ